MNTKDLLEKIQNGGMSAAQFAELLGADHHLLPAAIECLEIGSLYVQDLTNLTLRVLSEEKPCALYPYFNYFADFLTSTDADLRGLAMFVITRLAAVDCQHMLEGILDRSPRLRQLFPARAFATVVV